VRRRHVPEVGVQELGALGLAEPVVDGEVGQVEEHVAHPGVLPVDDPDPVAVVDEVRGQQVVVARPLGDRAARPLHERRRLVREREGFGDCDAVSGGDRGIRLDDAKRVESGRDRRAGVDRPQ
jgi:hypothetical protein